MFHQFRLTAVLAAFTLAVTGLASCRMVAVPESTEIYPGPKPPYTGRLSAISEPVDLPAKYASFSTCPLCSAEPWLSVEQHEAHIDPQPDSVEIRRLDTNSGIFNTGSIGFTSGTTRFAPVQQSSEDGSTTIEGKFLLPGPNASGLDWASYGVWGLKMINETGGETFVGEAVAFGVFTPFDSMPTSGSASYTGFMDGYYANAADQAFGLAGNAAMTANFGSDTITGQFTSITASPRTTGATTPATAFGDIGFSASIFGNRFSGNASTAGFGQAMSGELQGSFHGPAAQEAAGVFRMLGGGERAVGAFAVRQ